MEDKEEEMAHEKIQSNMDMHRSWNNFIEYSTMIMIMGKQESLVSEINLGLHNDQQLETQVEDKIIDTFRNLRILYLNSFKMKSSMTCNKKKS